jgi:hypothetical protein
VTGAEFVGAGQVITEAVTVSVPVTVPVPTTVCVGPETVMVVVIRVVTPGSKEVMVVPLWVIVNVLPGRTVGVVTVIMLSCVVVIGGITKVDTIISIAEVVIDSISISSLMDVKVLTSIMVSRIVLPDSTETIVTGNDL